VDRRSLGGAAGHPGDHERCGEPLADEVHREVDVVERELGQRLVHHVDMLEQRGPRRIGATRGRDLEMVGLAPGDRRLARICHVAVVRQPGAVGVAAADGSPDAVSLRAAYLQLLSARKPCAKSMMTRSALSLWATGFFR